MPKDGEDAHERSYNSGKRAMDQDGGEWGASLSPRTPRPAFPFEEDVTFQDSWAELCTTKVILCIPISCVFM